MSGLNRHNEVNHSDESQNPFKCDQCSKSFPKQFLLNTHQRIHSDKNFRCEQCSKSYHCSSALQNHIRIVHDKLSSHICDICAKIFRDKFSYAVHREQVHGVNQLPRVQCNECLVWLKNEKILTNHKKRCHNDDGTIWVCNICGKESANQMSLISHQKKIHGTEKNFKCSICEKAFRVEDVLRRHEESHNGNIIYSCSLCEKTFRSTIGVNCHWRKKHPIEWKNNKLKKILIVR